MREYAEKHPPLSRTLDTSARATTRASISEILQAYSDGTLGRVAVSSDNADDAHLLQIGSSEENSKLRNGTDQTRDGVAMQRKGAGINAVIQLERMMIDIQDDENTVKGYSGKEFETKSKLRQWPTIYEKFDALGEVDVLGEQGGYKRNAFMCAEPNAFANLLDRYSLNLAHGVSRAWFDQVSFLEKAKGVDSGQQKDPCPMCSKWVTNTPPLEIKDTVKPSDPIFNKLQQSKNEEETRDQYTFESKLSYFMDEEYEGGGSFDYTLSIRKGIENCYEELDEYSLGTLPSRHKEVWDKIIHENNGVNFVKEATEIYNSILVQKQNLLSREKIQMKDKNKAKEKIKNEMENYENLCSKAQPLDVIIQLVKELYVQNRENVGGDISNINRHVALLPVPVVEDVSLTFNYVMIEEDGNVMIEAFDEEDGHYSWESKMDGEKARLEQLD